MKKWLIVIVLICLSLIYFGYLINPERSHDKNRKMMVEKPVYEQVATTLVQYCQCVEGKIGLYQCAYLPEIFCELGFASESARGYISPDGAQLEVRGSSDPYGYRLEKTMDDPNLWELYYFSEDSGTIKLCTVSSNDIKPVSKDSIIERGEDFFDKHIQSNPSNASWHYNKVMFLIDILVYQKALHACDDAIKALNNDRWLRITKAFLMSETNKREAVTEFCEWIHSNKSFLNFMYLYYFAHSLGEKDLALSSIRMAIEEPLIAGDGYNIYYYGALMTNYAYEHNDSELALKVCDAMIDPLREKERKTSIDSSNFDFGRLKNALINNQKDKIEEFMNSCTELDLYKGHNVPWRRNRAQAPDYIMLL